MLRFMPRALARPTTTKTNGGYELLENHWVKASAVKKNDKVSVINVTGCSAVFLWTSANIPSAFHILCGNETPDMQSGAEMIADLGSAAKPVAATIMVNKHRQDLYKKLEAAIREFFPHLEILPFEKADPYDNDAKAATEAYRFDVVAGTRQVRKSKMRKLTSQPQGF